jgi:hypothetical protein
MFDFEGHALSSSDVRCQQLIREIFYGNHKTKRQPKLPFADPFAHQGQLHAVFLAELFDSAGSINDLLLAGVERVALRAHFDIQRLAVGGAGLELVAATAGYGDFVVIRMNVGFHSQCPCKRLSRKRAQLSKKLIN